MTKTQLRALILITSAVFLFTFAISVVVFPNTPTAIYVFLSVITLLALAAILALAEFFYIQKSHTGAMQKLWTDSMSREDLLKDACNRKNNQIKRLKHDISVLKKRVNGVSSCKKK
jgi:hypothetical protein